MVVIRNKLIEGYNLRAIHNLYSGSIIQVSNRPEYANKKPNGIEGSPYLVAFKIRDNS